MDTCWKIELEKAMTENGDLFEDCTYTLSDEELNTVFNSDYGTSQGEPFTAWTDNFVYFPVVYDGAEWVGCVPRNPCDIKTEHVGGQ